MWYCQVEFVFSSSTRKNLTSLKGAGAFFLILEKNGKIVKGLRNQF